MAGRRSTSDRSHQIASECDLLIDIAEAMPALAERRRAIASAWYGQLLELTQTPTLESPTGERAIDALVLRLRRAWMSTAHEHADHSYRSLPANTAKILPSRTSVTCEYERSLESAPLEARMPAYRPVPHDWAAAHLLFSSGMAALSGAMQLIGQSAASSSQGRSMVVAAAYYETIGLAELRTHGCTVRVVGDEAAFAEACAAEQPDVVFIEPIIYDPSLQPFDVVSVLRALAKLPSPPTVIIDSTLVGPTLPMTRILDECETLPCVIHVSSGLKLDQAGLELANVGIASIYMPASQAAELEAADRTMRMVRRLNGTALTIDTMALLDVPFFLDPAVFHDYSTAVFAQNTQLAHAVPAGALFETIAHPALDPRGLPWAQAPFVFFHLRDDTVERYQELEALVATEAGARGLAIERGGSFGFRGHRCEAVALDGSTRNGVFKVALGARLGPSATGIIKLLAEIATFPTVAAAGDAFGHPNGTAA